MAEILVRSDLAQARKIWEERRTYFSKRVDERIGEYRELAPILRMLGIIYCNEGHHDDGVIAAAELVQIVRMLDSTFPTLQERVKNRLRHQANVPILEFLEKICRELECKHKEEVSSILSSII